MKRDTLENPELLEAVLQSGVTLPSPGSFLPAVQKAGNDPRAGVKEFANAVRGDPAIVAAVMRVANSAVFRAPRKSESLEQAISSIGYAKLLAVTSSVALNGYIDLIDPGLRESVQLIFDESNRAADLAYAVARESNYKRLADMAYLTALLQDSGTIVLAQRSGVTSFYHNMNDEHASLGAAVMRNFRMPPAIAEAVGVHHRPMLAARKDAEVYAIACLAATGRCLAQKYVDSDEWKSWADHVTRVLGITPENIMRIHDEYFQG